MGSKLNLIIDGNFHFHKSLYASTSYSKGRLLGTQKDKDVYMRKLAMDLAFGLRMFPAPDRVVFTMDDYSWRKSVEIEENTGYKANRERDESAVDWAAFNEINKDFFKIVEEKGFIASTLSGCEGDDLMYFWANKFYENGEDVIIYSGDGDIPQLTKFNENNFICVFNIKSTERKIIGAPGFGEWLIHQNNKPIDAIDAFMGSDFLPSTHAAVQAVINNSKLVEIEPEDILFDKIVCGDGGDNIPPMITWKTVQKTGKTITNKISNAKAVLIKNAIINKYGVVDVSNLSKYAEIFKDEIAKLYKKDFDLELIKRRLDRNTILVILGPDTIPLNIQNLFEKHFNLFTNHGAPRISKMDIQGLLEGSKYWSQPTGIDADIFKTAAPKNIKPIAKTKTLF